MVVDLQAAGNDRTYIKYKIASNLELALKSN
jgi:hypothetical protein